MVIGQQRKEAGNNIQESQIAFHVVMSQATMEMKPAPFLGPGLISLPESPSCDMDV